MKQINFFAEIENMFRRTQLEKALLIAILLSSIGSIAYSLSAPPDVLRDGYAVSNSQIDEILSKKTTKVSIVESFGNFYVLDTTPPTIMMSGEISDGDVVLFRRALRSVDDVEFVVLDSPGGLLYEGMEMASIIHDKGLKTIVHPKGVCLSACSVMFFGGIERYTGADALGVHQFYNSQSNVAYQSRTQLTVGEVIEHLNDFDTPPYVYEKMLITAPEQMYYFSKDEIEQLNTLNINSFPVEISLLPKRTKTTEVLLAEKAKLPEKTIKPDVPSKKYYEGHDFYGEDILKSGLKDVSIVQCENYCREHGNCAAFSYIRSSRWCWPKYAVSNMSFGSGITSAILDYSKVDRSIFEREFIEGSAVDISGFDIYQHGIKNLTLDGCRKACVEESKCVAFSWVIAKKWCFPKYAVGEISDSTGIISGLREGYY